MSHETIIYDEAGTMDFKLARQLGTSNKVIKRAFEITNNSPQTKTSICKRGEAYPPRITSDGMDCRYSGNKTGDIFKKVFPNSTTAKELDDWANENCTEIIHIYPKATTTEIEYKMKGGNKN